MNPRISFHKIVISGQIVEVFQSSKPVGYNLQLSKTKSGGRQRRALSEQEITQSSLSRTKHTLIRLINANSRMWQNDAVAFEPQFLTYTFQENVTDVTIANPIFTNYIKRLNYKNLGSKTSLLKYVVVPEFQKRGAVHYHAVFFNLPMINASQEFKTGEFASLWREGFIKKKTIKHIPNVGLYMTKYMTKDATDRRLIGKKKYFSSRGLIKPTIINQEHLAKDMKSYLSEFTPIYMRSTLPTEDGNYYTETPIFCATYNLNPEQLSGLKSFYSLNV